MLEVLKSYKDRGLMKEDLWKNDTSAVHGLATLGESQQQWISAVLLNDEVKHLGRLANFVGYALREDQRRRLQGDDLKLGNSAQK